MWGLTVWGSHKAFQNGFQNMSLKCLFEKKKFGGKKSNPSPKVGNADADTISLGHYSGRNPSTEDHINEPCHKKTSLMAYANNKDADLTAVRISAFVIGATDSTISINSVKTIASFLS